MIIEIGDPHIPVRIREHRGTWILSFVCPFGCNKDKRRKLVIHTHGAGSADSPPTLGHRVSHCPNYQGYGYILIEASTQEGN